MCLLTRLKWWKHKKYFSANKRGLFEINFLDVRHKRPRRCSPPERRRKFDDMPRILFVELHYARLICFRLRTSRLLRIISYSPEIRMSDSNDRQAIF